MSPSPLLPEEKAYEMAENSVLFGNPSLVTDVESLVCRFCRGLELGKLVVSSGLLRLSWSKILELHGSIDPNQDSNLRFHIYEEAKYIIVAFVAPPVCTRRYLFNEDCSVNSALTLLNDSSLSNPFHFLFSEKISSFSVHSPAYELFKSVDSCLKSQLLSCEKPLIITGSELGGSVASLFTLGLLDSNKWRRKCPLCITFGSPLIGDTSLQQILESSIWYSCFLHVASIDQDLLPKLLVPCNYSPLTFKPFGTFMVCCESGCVCVDCEAVLEFLASIDGVPLDDSMYIYGKILERLESSLVLMRPNEPASDWIFAGMFLQSDHLGMGLSQDYQDVRVIRDIIMKMEECSQKRKQRYDPFNKLPKMKTCIYNLECYRIKCANKGIGYYDHFKSKFYTPNPVAERVEKFKTELTMYWQAMVEEAEKNPQKEKAAFRKRNLYAGTNYRRMVEPLDIAKHYHENKSKEHYKSCRSRHYILLEKWLEEEGRPENRSTKHNLKNLLILDSCFWAEVEQAIISIESLNDGGIGDSERETLTQKLDEFEKYVWDMIQEKTVSPEIFLEGSCFMKWWGEYEKFKEVGYKSPFTDFMNKRRYKDYSSL